MRMSRLLNKGGHTVFMEEVNKIIEQTIVFRYRNNEAQSTIEIKRWMKLSLSDFFNFKI